MDMAYRFGIEEEYFLADAATRGTPAADAARRFHVMAGDRLPGVGREVLQAQIEVQTEPGTDLVAARDRLRFCRQTLGALGRELGLLVFSSGTHPRLCWPEQELSEGDRYTRMVAEYGILAARNMVCALHVHVEVARPDERAALMGRLVPYLPVLLALSASSPFWEGRHTGLASYRMAAYREWPRSGLPARFDDDADYTRFLRIMTGSGAIPDASFLWWAVRPARAFPTLELRVCDACPDVDDAVAITALYRCLVRLLERRPEIHARLSGTSLAVAAENFWRAQQGGVGARLIDEQAGALTPLAAHADTLLQAVAEDADALGCAGVLAGVRDIVARGTGADRQREVWHGAGGGAAALDAVVDWLARAH